MLCGATERLSDCPTVPTASGSPTLRPWASHHKGTFFPSSPANDTPRPSSKPPGERKNPTAGSGEPQWEQPVGFVPIVREDPYASTPQEDFVKSVLSPKRSKVGREPWSAMHDRLHQKRGARPTSSPSCHPSVSATHDRRGPLVRPCPPVIAPAERPPISKPRILSEGRARQGIPPLTGNPWQACCTLGCGGDLKGRAGRAGGREAYQRTLDRTHRLRLDTRKLRGKACVVSWQR